MSFTEHILGVENTEILRSLDVQLVFLISIVSSMGSIASPALTAMIGALGVPEARIGLVFTAFTFPAIFTLPMVGVAADLYGQKAVMVPGMLLFGTAGLAVGLTQNFRLLLLLRGLQGIGYTAFNSLTVALLGDLLSGSTESAAQGARVLLNKLASFAGPAIVGVFAAIAWYYPFYLYGLAIPVGVLVYLRLGGTIESEHSFGGVDGDGDGDDADDRGLRGYAVDVRSLLADPYIAGVLGAGFFRMFLKYALLLGFVIAGVAFLAFPLAGGLIAVTVLVLIHGIGEGIINPIHKSILSQSVETDLRAGLVTSNATIQNAAKTVTPVILGPILVLSDASGYALLFTVVGDATLVASFAAVVTLAFGSSSKRRQ